MSDTLHKKKIHQYLDLIVERSNRVEVLMKGVSESEFRKNETLQEAVCMNLVVIGEESSKIRKLPENKGEFFYVSELNPQIEFKNAVALRNLIAHGYFKMDFPQIYSIAKNDIPVLKEQIVELKKDFPHDEKAHSIIVEAKKQMSQSTMTSEKKQECLDVLRQTLSKKLDTGEKDLSKVKLPEQCAKKNVKAALPKAPER